MTSQPDDKSEEYEKAAEELKEQPQATQATQELDTQTEEEIEDAQADVEAEGKSPRELYKKVKRQLKAVMEYIGQMRGLERANRKWLEKRLEFLEEEVLELRVELKSFKALSKQAKGKGDK